MKIPLQQIFASHRSQLQSEEIWQTFVTKVCLVFRRRNLSCCIIEGWGEGDSGVVGSFLSRGKGPASWRAKRVNMCRQVCGYQDFWGYLTPRRKFSVPEQRVSLTSWVNSVKFTHFRFRFHNSFLPSTSRSQSSLFPWCCPLYALLEFIVTY